MTNQSDLMPHSCLRGLQLIYVKLFPQGECFICVASSLFIQAPAKSLNIILVSSTSLTKILSTSIQNFEVIGKNGTEGGPQEDSDVSCLPVTEWTWREVAKMAIIYDVLTDLGYSKQESANFVKGYRSGGHPKSNEAKRWKKIEESNLVMMYSRIKNNGEDNQLRSRLVRAIISTPCTPSSVPSDWRFFLHNIKSRSTSSARFIKVNQLMVS